MSQYKKGLRGTHEFNLNTKLYGAYLRFQSEMIDIDSYGDFEYLVDEHIGEFGIILEDYKTRLEKKIEYLLRYFKYGKSKIVFVAGARDCLPKGTMVKTCSSYSKPIEKVTQVESYNFQKRKKEVKKAKVYGPFKKRIWKIYTEEGIVECSGEHKWFVKREGRIIVIPTNEINPRTDVLIKHTKNMKYSHTLKGRVS